MKNTSIYESDIITKHNLTFEFTACCGADSKGLNGYVGCRSCGRVITDRFSDGEEKSFLFFCRTKEKNRFTNELKKLKKENEITKIYTYRFMKDESFDDYKVQSWISDIPKFENNGLQALEKAKIHLADYVKAKNLDSTKYNVVEKVSYKYKRKGGK